MSRDHGQLVLPESPQSQANSPAHPSDPSPYCYYRAMDTQQNLPQVPKVQFRVLVVGKANAGKTSILQRLCDTTESPEIYNVDSSGDRQLVRSTSPS